MGSFKLAPEDEGKRSVYGAVSLPKDIWDKLDEESERLDLSRSGLVRQILMRHYGLKFGYKPGRRYQGKMGGKKGK